MTLQIPHPVLAGRKALVVGIANEHSIAWGCAKAFRELGAEVAVTYLNEKSLPHVQPLAAELGSVTLIPDDTGGVFEVKVDGRQIWSRKDHGRFPEMKELKQLIRDEVAPERDLGHIDSKEPKP